jgi:3-hydroxy-9,10-secoandrosta-1,3,5(10)-triene-9,17-dione monooxygenase reductase component
MATADTVENLSDQEIHMADQPDSSEPGPSETADMDIEVDPKEFRSVLGHFPTGVTVVAGADDSGAHGLAIGSFFSISLDPPLVGFCVGESSQSWAKVAATGKFSVNVLSEHQVEVSNMFAGKAEDKFAGSSWTPGPVTGSPWIDDAVAHLDCELETVHPGGDHQIVVGRVRSLQVHRTDHGPLLFFKGGYGRHTSL